MARHGFIHITMHAVGDVAAVSEGFCPRCLVALTDWSICATCRTSWEIHRDINPFTDEEMPPVARGIQSVSDRGADAPGSSL
jgi:hypothetical protein